MKHRRFQGIENAPWITPEGFLDAGKFPIEVPIRQCLDPKSERFRDGCTFLGSMASRGRVDAGIFLLGLLRSYEQDLPVARTIVESLQEFPDATCVDALFGELRRVPSSNRTRRYLDTVINALRALPADMVKRRFQELARDTAFSYRMRAKFAAAGEIVEDWDSWPDLEDET